MNKRIKTILKYIDVHDTVLDVGCDQALLGESLALKGISSYAGDIKENIIENASKRIKDLGLDKYITFKVSDGTTSFQENKDINTLVIAGMGTHTILGIIKSSSTRYPKVITISNNDHYLLRKEFSSLGYLIDKEEIIYEKGKYYNLIVFIKGKSSYNEKELHVGVNHQNIELLKSKNEYLISKYKSILKNANNEKLKMVIEYLEE